ncbi:Serine carboxypeptidase 1 [Linum grandiflorum]
MINEGPFNFEKGKSKASPPKLHLNPFSWSKWLEMYPDFQQNSFYISGESYAGIYVPTLASQVVQGIKARIKPAINFKDAAAACEPNFSSNRKICHNIIDKIDKVVRQLNIYDVLEPCYHHPQGQQLNQPKLPASFRQLGKTNGPLQVRKRMFGRAWPLWADHFINFRPNSTTAAKDMMMPLWPQLAQQAGGVLYTSSFPQNDEVATTWLNNESVRKALHAQPISTTGSWELCTDRVSYLYGAASMVPIHRSLTTQGYRALIYRFNFRRLNCIPNIEYCACL